MDAELGLPWNISRRRAAKMGRKPVMKKHSCCDQFDRPNHSHALQVCIGTNGSVLEALAYLIRRTCGLQMQKPLGNCAFGPKWQCGANLKLDFLFFFILLYLLLFLFFPASWFSSVSLRETTIDFHVESSSFSGIQTMYKLPPLSSNWSSREAAGKSLRVLRASA